MTTTNTRLGPNSHSVSYGPMTTQAELNAALQAVMELQGWAVHDAQAGTNAVCYRAAIADGLMAFKYLVLDTNTAGVLLTKVYETWNAVTHAGTNLALQSELSHIGQRLSLATGGLVWVYASSRYAVFYSRTSTLQYGDLTYESFTGCIEISRDNADEVPGTFPTYAWVNGGLALGTIAGTAGLYCLALPRTRLGALTDMASRFQSIGTIAGRSGISFPLRTALPIAANPLSVNGGQFAFTAYSIDMTNMTTPSHVRGRLYGMKILAAQIGTPGDTINIKVDGSMFMDNSQSSTVVAHVILGEKNLGRFAFPV